MKIAVNDSFSANHTLPYSCICLQEMNLAYHKPKIFWNTSCLTINAGADEDNENNKTTKYGKIAKAIGAISNQGQKIALPDINRVKFGFIPDTVNDEIVFSLKGICGIGDEIAKAIVDNQPYENFDDFLEKMKTYKDSEKGNKFGDGNVITLIKAGCFDKLSGLSRTDLMKKYINIISAPITELKLSHMDILYKLNLLTKSEQSYEYRLYRFKQRLYTKENFFKATGKTPSTNFYLVEPNKMLPFFYEHFETLMVEEKDYECVTDGLIVKRGSVERVFDKLIQNFKDTTLKNPNLLEIVNNQRFSEIWDDKASGTVSHWEMESLSFYYGEHELSKIDMGRYSIVDFETLPETPIVVEYKKYGKKEIPRFQLSRISGTVLDKDKNKNTVSVLTPSGVVDVKFYKGQFSFYDKQTSEINENGIKKVIEKSWFTRGNKILITGIRRGEQFSPRKYADSAYRHTLQLITSIEEDGSLHLQSERKGYEENDR